MSALPRPRASQKPVTAPSAGNARRMGCGSDPANRMIVAATAPIGCLREATRSMAGTLLPVARARWRIPSMESPVAEPPRQLRRFSVAMLRELMAMSSGVCRVVSSPASIGTASAQLTSAARAVVAPACSITHARCTMISANEYGRGHHCDGVISGRAL